jgi:hypothetical protein
MLQGVDKERGLARLGRRRRAHDGHGDIATDVGEETPEQAVRDFVESKQAEQLLRAQQG